MTKNPIPIIDDKAAKEIAEVIKDTIDSSLATKRDLKELETILKRDMIELELRLKHDLTIRMAAIVTGAVAAIAAIVKLL